MTGSENIEYFLARPCKVSPQKICGIKSALISNENRKVVRVNRLNGPGSIFFDQSAQIITSAYNT
jgi:hypothetical protein